MVVEGVPEEALVTEDLPCTIIRKGISAGQATQDIAGQALGCGPLRGGVVEVEDGAKIEIHC